MSHLPAQRRTDAPPAADAEVLVARLCEDLERTISFAEECRWRFPEIGPEADHLTEAALALFGRTMRCLRTGSQEH